MTDATASLPPKLLLAQPPSGNVPGLEDDSVGIAKDGPAFAEVLDILNPLHHIPSISTIYLAITGDEIGAGAHFVGGVLFRRTDRRGYCREGGGGRYRGRRHRQPPNSSGHMVCRSRLAATPRKSAASGPQPVAQQAAQKMSQQNGPTAAASKTAKSDDEDTGTAAQKSAAHPMMPPRNASPEWCAQAMDKALNHYRTGSNTLPAGVPTLSVTRRTLAGGGIAPSDKSL